MFSQVGRKLKDQSFKLIHHMTFWKEMACIFVLLAMVIVEQGYHTQFVLWETCTPKLHNNTVFHFLIGRTFSALDNLYFNNFMR